VVRRQLCDLRFAFKRIASRDYQPFDVFIEHIKDYVQVFAEERVEVGPHHLQVVLNTLRTCLEG
jgi:hypothetical protein